MGLVYKAFNKATGELAASTNQSHFKQESAGWSAWLKENLFPNLLSYWKHSHYTEFLTIKQECHEHQPEAVSVHRNTNQKLK